MGHERQAARNSYFYRNARINGRVVTTYLGSGEQGRARLQQEDESAKNKAQQAHETATLIAEIDQLCTDVDRVLEATLIEAGYHRHNRGEWRKRHMNNPHLANLTPHDPQEQPYLRIQSPKTPRAREPESLITREPDSLITREPQRIVDLYGQRQQDLLIKRLGAPDRETALQNREDIRNMEEALLSEGNSPTETLLVRRVVVCYIALNYFECLYLQSMTEHQKPRDHALELLRMHQANERYINALRTLAQVRKLKALSTTYVGIVTKLLSLATLPIESHQLPEEDPTDQQ